MEGFSPELFIYGLGLMGGALMIAWGLHRMIHRRKR